MLYVKLLGGGGGEIHADSHCFNQESEKQNPRVLGLSRGVNKNLECFLKCIFTGRSGTRHKRRIRKVYNLSIFFI